MRLDDRRRTEAGRKGDLSSLGIWREPDLKGLMPWYRAVADNRRPAKFRIAGRVPVGVSLDAPEENLWAELGARTPEFLDLWSGIRSGRDELPVGPRPAITLVDLARELAYRMLAHCNFCRYDCRVDRTSGLRAQSAVSKTASGSALNSRANPDLLSRRDEAGSQDHAVAPPIPILEVGLAKGFSRTEVQENPQKFGTCKLGQESRVSSYFHHLGEELVYRGRMGSGTIFFTSCNMRCAFCQNGDISTDKDNGRAVSPRTLATMAWLLRVEGCHNINWVGGDPTIHLHTIRHLVMPNHVECCTLPVLKWVADNVPGVPVNIMDQYHPDTSCDPASPKFNPKYRDLSRRAGRDEILQAYRYGRELGIRFESLSWEKNASGLRL